MDALERWLTQNGLSHHLELFRQHRIDLDVVAQLSDDLLSEIGIPIGDRLRFLRAIAQIEDGQAELDEPTQLPLGGEREGQLEAERRQVTVMFVDIAGSTRLSVALDMEDYRELLRRYQTTVATLIEARGGFVARYMGDGILAYFGYPNASEDDAERAVSSALEIVAAVSDIPLPNEGYLASRIGVATGTVVIGDLIGRGVATERTVAGATPNLAARLQSVCPTNAVMIAQSTHELVRGSFEIRQLGTERLKGFDQEIPLLQAVAERPVSRFEARTGGNVLPMVNREPELAMLLHEWRSLEADRGCAHVLVGEPGIGKSRLLEKFIEDVAQPHCLIRSACSPQHGHTALYPFARTIRWLAQFSPADDNELRRKKLRHFLGSQAPAAEGELEVLSELISLSPRPPKTDLGEKFVDVAGTSILRMLAALASRTPVLLSIEDVHWSDPSSHVLIEKIIRQADRSRMMVVATERTNQDVTLTTLPDVGVTKLRRLPAKQAREVIANVRGGASMGLATAAAVIERADGIPLHIEQLTQSVLVDQEASQEIPISLRDALMARLDRLGEGKRIAQTASVIGRSFNFGLLLEVMDLDVTALQEALTELETAMVLTAVDFETDPVFQFRHALLKDLAYDSILRDRLRELHRRVGYALEARMDEHHSTEPEAVAAHFEAGELFERAVSYWEVAGRHARQHSAHREAEVHYARALTLVEKLPDARRPELELNLRIELGGQLIACYGNGSTSVAQNYERAQELVHEVEDPQLAFRALHGLRTFYIVRGPLRRAHELGERLLLLAQELNEDSLSLQAHRPHGLCLFAMGELADACEHLEKAIDLYRSERHAIQRFEYISDPLVLARCNLGWALVFLGDRDRATYECNQAVELASRMEHRHSLAFALSIAASTHQALNQRSLVSQFASRALALSEENDYPYWTAWNRMLAAWASSDAPELKLDQWRLGIEAYSATDARMMLPYFFTLYADALLAAGLPDDAVKVSQMALASVSDTDTRFYLGELHRVRAAAFAAQALPGEQVRTELLSGLAIAEQQGNELLKARLNQALDPGLRSDGPAAFGGPSRS